MIILMMAKLYQVSYIRRRSGKTGNICGRGREYISRKLQPLWTWNFEQLDYYLE